MKKFTLTLFSAAAIWLCMASNSMAGPDIHFGVVVGPPVFYAPGPYYGPYYRPYYGPGYYGGPRFYWHGGYRHWR